MLFDQGLGNHLQLEKNTTLASSAGCKLLVPGSPFIHLGGCGLIKDGHFGGYITQRFHKSELLPCFVIEGGFCVVVTGIFFFLKKT